VKAVNLMPAEERGGAGGAGRSGMTTYALLGALAVMLVAALAYALAAKAVNDRRATLADVRAQADAAQERANALNAYVRFSQLRAKRVETVTSLIKGRFDWAHTLHEVARVLPQDTWITSLKGNTTPAAAAAGATPAPAAGTGPSVELSGCTSSQQGLARVMARLRMVDGVQGVTVSSSAKSDADAAGSCGKGRPQFDLSLAFAAPGAAPTPSTAAQQGASR
jgi:Tfp pilus assembly protein PilN